MPIMNKIFFLIYYLIGGFTPLRFERFGAIGFNFCWKNKDVNELCAHMKAEETGLAMEHIACEPSVMVNALKYKKKKYMYIKMNN